MPLGRRTKVLGHQVGQWNLCWVTRPPKDRRDTCNKVRWDSVDSMVAIQTQPNPSNPSQPKLTAQAGLCAPSHSSIIPFPSLTHHSCWLKANLRSRRGRARDTRPEMNTEGALHEPSAPSERCFPAKKARRGHSSLVFS